MRKWDKKRKDLEETIAIVGTVKAYGLIPEEMPVGEWPEKLIEYHNQRFDDEAINDVPSPALEARIVRIDELKRGEIRPKRRKYEKCNCKT